MKKTIVDNWNFIMNHDKNPLKNIPDTNTRHMIMQILAWMWCIVFSMYFSSMWIFGITTIAHILIWNFSKIKSYLFNNFSKYFLQ